jgi:outer membrane protein
VHEARSRNDLARAQVISARNELDAKRSALEQITGSAPGRVARLRAGVRPPRPPPESGSAWVALARDNSPTVRIQTAAVEVAEREVTRARAGHWPTLDLTASKSKDYSAGSLTSPANLEVDSQSSTIGLQLSVPLFAGGAVSARVGEARSLVYKARADLDAARRSAAHAARLAHSGVINGLAQLEAMEQAVASSKSAVEGNKIGYRVGTRINVDVLNAEQQLYSAERDLARARYDTLQQGLRLKAAAGQLAEKDLQSLNDLLARE